jgi:cytochrome c biogenesis protein CcdA
MKPIAAFGGGLAGAAAVTLLHESVKRIVPEAPRMDLLGMNAISKGLNAAGINTPNNTQLFVITLAGDLLANSLYYSAAGIGKEKNIWLRSSLLGLAAGIGAVTLPGPLGLNEKHSNRTTATKLMTVGLYVAGAVVTTAVIKLLSTTVEKKKHKKHQEWERRLVTSAMG